MADTSHTSITDPVPMVAGRPWSSAQAPEKISHTGLMVMFRSSGFAGGWTGAPITTPGNTADMENFG